MNANLYALFRAHFDERAGEPCLLIPDGPVIRYDQLDATSARFAHVLAEAGCARGDRVAVQVDKCWEAWHSTSHVCAPGSFTSRSIPATRRASSATSSPTRSRAVIVCRPDSTALVSALRPEATMLTLAGAAGTLHERAAGRAETFEPVPTKPDELAAILYTSGTTGRAKGAMLSHRNLGSNALSLVDAWGFTRGDVLLHALPIYHVHGLFVAVHCALLAGARMLWLAKFDPAQVRPLLPRATVMMGVPTFYTRLLADSAFGADDCRSMRLFVSGSAPLLPDTFDEFRARTGHTILERYGMSETGMNTSNPLTGERIARHRGASAAGCLRARGR